MIQKKQPPWGLIILLVCSALVMGALNAKDHEWTVWLRSNRIDVWGDFMRRTMFEGSGFGGSDLGIWIMLIPAVIYFFVSPNSRFPRLKTMRPQLGFLFFSTLVIIGLVHSVKWMMGRARPDLVIQRGIDFSRWFEFGPLHVSDGVFWGSFPSGHTATTIVMITFAYILAASKSHAFRTRLLGWCWGVLVILYGISMSVGRSMTEDHWLTDGIGTIFIGWIVIHLIYFKVLKIPQQISYTRNQGSYADLPRFWELMLIWRLFIITLAVMAIVIGIKAVIFQAAPLLILMLIPALPVGFVTGKSLIRIYTGIMSRFDIPNPIQPQP